MEKGFSEGYEYVCRNLSGAAGIEVSQAWLNSVESGIKDLKEHLIDEASHHQNMDVKQLQGFINEVWHTDTFNINAKIHNSSSIAEMLGENGFGSTDVRVTHGSSSKDYSLKSYVEAKKSVKALSETPWERYNSNKSRDTQTFDEFLKERGIDETEGKLSMYKGQGKILSSDQLEEARELLNKKINSLKNKETITEETPIQIKRYTEVLKTLDDVVKDGRGTESVELSHDQAIELAKAAQKGDISEELLKECGIDIKDLVSASDVFQEAMKAGLTAAALSAVMSLAPMVINGISKLIAEGEIDVEELKKGGIKALKDSARGFLTGSLTGGINICCQTGKFGSALTDVNPSLVSALVVAAVGTAETAIDMVAGKISKGEMAFRMMKMYVSSAFSYIGGTIFTSICAGFPLAYMVGSMIGSMLGGLIYKAAENLFISFCINSGCTFFGLVEQNYEIPKEILDGLEIDLFEFDKIETETFDFDRFKPEQFSYSTFKYEQFGLKVLKRGLIGVYSVGYVEG